MLAGARREGFRRESPRGVRAPPWLSSGSLDQSAAPISPDPAMRFRLACLGALVLVAGCRTASPPSAGTSPRPSLALPDLLHLAASDAEALLRRLPKSARAETEPVENRHVPGQIDTLRTLAYDGLRIQLYEAADGS